MLSGSQRPLGPRKITLLISLALMILVGFSYFHPNESSIPNVKDPEPVSPIITDNNYQGLKQDDPRLISYIRSLMRPPSTEPYHLSSPNRKHFTAMEQSKFVGNLYGPGKRESCFFVESGV
ncbi:uncharacterized protein LOC135217950 [Macrobrachium nipponense]|uniref:uncharacterized protein LOC135217950 n=1 Tax=Macrobrachium nipponense TaxID=159736 RepID=UPI0030C7D865